MEVDDDLFEVAYWRDQTGKYSLSDPGNFLEPMSPSVAIIVLRGSNLSVVSERLATLRRRYQVPRADRKFFIRLFSERNRFRFMCMLLIEQNKTPAGEPAGANTRKDQHESQCAAIDSTPDTSVNSFYQRSDLTFKPVADSSKPTQQ